MKDNVILCFLIVTLFISLLGGLPDQTMEVTSESTEMTAKVSDVQNYTPHGAINISGNADFISTASNESWQGQGTASSPFIIEGYFFDNESQYNIQIQDTTVHFIIQNVWSTGSIDTVSIWIANVSNCIIRNSILANADSAIRANDGENITISQNTIENCSEASMALSGITNSTIVGNTISTIGPMGASMIFCDKLKMIGNLFINSIQGLFLGACNNTEILNNRFEGLRILDMVFIVNYNMTVNIEIEGGTDARLGIWTSRDYDYLCYRNSENFSLGWQWFFNDNWHYALNIDSFELGLFNYTFIITNKADGSLSAYSTLWLNIRDKTAPQISHPPDILTNSSSVYLTWIGIDTFNDTYQVYLNGRQIGSGFWSSYDPIYIYIDGLSPGTSEVTLHLFDSSGNEITDTLLIVVPVLATSTTTGPATSTRISTTTSPTPSTTTSTTPRTTTSPTPRTTTSPTTSTSGYLIEIVVFSVAVLYLYKRRK